MRGEKPSCPLSFTHEKGKSEGGEFGARPHDAINAFPQSAGFEPAPLSGAVPTIKFETAALVHSATTAESGHLSETYLYEH